MLPIPSPFVIVAAMTIAAGIVGRIAAEILARKSETHFDRVHSYLDDQQNRLEALRAKAEHDRALGEWRCPDTIPEWMNA